MTKNILRIIFLAMGLLLFNGIQAPAKTIKIQTKSVTVVKSEAKDSLDSDDTFFDQGALVTVKEEKKTPAESIFPGKSPNLAFSHFTWGSEFGSTIDLTGHDLSTFDVDINFGFKNSFIKLAGIGVGFHRGIDSGDTYIPIYGVIRTSFRRKPSLFFLNVQVGYSFNTVQGSKYHGDMVSALGCGLNLTQSSRAKSYIILSVGSRYFNKNHKEITSLDVNYVTTAKIVFGVHF